MDVHPAPGQGTGTQSEDGQPRLTRGIPERPVYPRPGPEHPPNLMVVKGPLHDRPIPRRKALLGISSEYVLALEDLANAQEVIQEQTEKELAEANEANTELAGNLQSARLALGEATGWSERLPETLRVLADLAAGATPEQDAGHALAHAVMTLAGEHLIGGVQIAQGDPEGEIERETSRNENGRPVKTIVRLGGIVVQASWQPGVDAGPDTTDVVESMCEAVVCSLAGVERARTDRDTVTQLADGRALARHLALRQRLGEPAAIVQVSVEAQSAIEYRELYGRLAWSASLAHAAGTLERIARAHGGQAYQTGEREMRMLIDLNRAEQARQMVEDALADSEEYSREGPGEHWHIVFQVEILSR